MLAALAGVAIRCLPWRSVFSDGQVVLAGVDPSYHLWRARMLVERFFDSPLFDPYISFPDGAPIPWPPGFDALVALPGLLTGDAFPIETWGAVLMPLLGGVAVYLTYRLGSRVFDRATGLLAAVLLAFLNAAVGFSYLGRVDHHALVAPVCLGMFLSFLACLDSRTRAGTWAWGAVTGALAAAAVGSWSVTPPLYFLPLPATLLWLCLEDRHRAVRQAAVAVTICAALLVLVAVLLTADLQCRPWALYQPSWLSVLLFALCAAMVLLGVFRPRLAMIASSVAVVGAVATVALAPEWVSPLSEGVRIAAGDDPSYLLSKESDSLLFQEGVFTLRRAALQYTYLITLWPVIWGAFMWRHRKTETQRAGLVLLAAWIPLSLGLTVIRQRFGEYSAPVWALLLAWALVEGGRVLIRFARGSWHRTRVAVLGAGLVAALGASLSPLVCGPFLAADHARGTFAYQRALTVFGKALARHTPDPTGPDGRPTWGLLTSWLDAHTLLQTSGRPVMISSFGTPEALAGNRKGFGILLAREEESAVQRMTDSRIRYVVVSPIVKQVNSMARMAGLNDEFVRKSRRHVDGRIQIELQPLQPFAECLHTRLYLADGSHRKVLGGRLEPLAHFRLHLESGVHQDPLGLSLPLFKAFEVVTGANLQGRTAPGETVWLRLTVQTNAGRRFLYERQSVAGPDGRFSFVVPYANEGSDTPCRPIGPYRLKIGGRVVYARVSEENVRNGSAVDL